jgi:hypothetical protein
MTVEIEPVPRLTFQSLDRLLRDADATERSDGRRLSRRTDGWRSG